MKYFVLTFFAFLLFVSCQKTDSQPQEVQEEQLENVVVRNYNGTGLDVTISPFSTTRTSENEMKEETFLITIENPDDEESILESLIVVERLSDATTRTTHTTVDGEIFAVFICKNGKVVDLTVPDDNVVATRGIGSWFSCVKQQYKAMSDIIYSDLELAIIASASNAIRPGIVESEIAVSAAIWCAK